MEEQRTDEAEAEAWRAYADRLEEIERRRPPIPFEQIELRRPPSDVVASVKPIGPDDHWGDLEGQCGPMSPSPPSPNISDRLTDLINQYFVDHPLSPPAGYSPCFSLMPGVKLFESTKLVAAVFDGRVGWGPPGNQNPLYLSAPYGLAVPENQACFSPPDLQSYLDSLVMLIEQTVPPMASFEYVTMEALWPDHHSGQHSNYHSITIVWSEVVCVPLKSYSGAVFGPQKIPVKGP